MSKRRITFNEPSLYVASSSCGQCHGHGSFLRSGKPPFNEVACSCEAGKAWAARAAAFDRRIGSGAE